MQTTIIPKPKAPCSLSPGKFRKACRKKRKFGFAGAAVSDTGCLRPNNEDNYILGRHMNRRSSDYSVASVCFPDSTGGWQLAGVFDGMGGGEMGELASHDIAQIFLDSFSRLSRVSSKAEADICLRGAFLEANNRILALQKEYKVFGTTGTVLCSNGNSFKIYHLGDSRAYLFRDEILFQLTADQTLAQMKQDLGMYRASDPSAEAEKHTLTKYIGCDRTGENITPAESLWIPIQCGDRVLLCSDGLYDMCSDEEITNTFLEIRSLEETAAALTEKAILNGGEDNVTCIVVAFD